MSVKIRLKRLGKIRSPHYRIVVADSRTKRDGRVIEEIGQYHPTENPSIIEIKSERALYWLGVGAQPTEQVMALLKLTGDWGTFKGEKGAKNTVRTAEAKPEFQADEKKKPVLKPKAEAPTKAEAPAKAEKAAKAEIAAKDAESSADDAPAEETPTPEVVADDAAEAKADDSAATSTEADNAKADDAAADETKADETKADDADDTDKA